jgi:hypothetical protein
MDGNQQAMHLMHGKIVMCPPKSGVNALITFSVAMQVGSGFALLHYLILR